MKILLLEYITGGGLVSEPLPQELVREADSMLNAQLRDLAGRTLGILRDRRLPPPVSSGGRALLSWRVDGDFWADWQTALGWADAVWVTAPETGGVLARLSDQVLESGRRLLGSRPEAVAVAGDKLVTLNALSRAGVACVPTWALGSRGVQVAPPWVVKPRAGVGCEGVSLVTDPAQLEDFPADWLLQPFVAGETVSLSAVFAAGRAVLLSVNRQMMREVAGRFVLTGCEVNALPDPGGRWQALCDRIARVMPGLWGYAGVDLVVAGENAFVLEVNPRLTLSYAGLSEALGEAVGGWVVALAEGKLSIEDIAHRRRRISGRPVWVAA